MAPVRNHPIVWPVLAIAVVLACCGSVWAVEFAGGTGEPNDPYQIATAEQLIAISSDRTLYDRHFVLVADIDLDPTLPGRKIFDGPVIDWTVPRIRAGQDGLLHGSFDGNGHVIRNCTIFRTTGQYYAALIGQVAEEGVVRAVHLENVVVTEAEGSNASFYYCGALVAVNYGTVVDCSATGIIAADRAGGLIGRNAGIVARCSADCSIFGGNEGGLIAVNDAAGRVVLCRSGGIVYGAYNYLAGGIAATNSGTIQYCTTNAYVSGGESGGIVGENRGWVRESFSTAMMAVGGIAYRNYGTIVNCYATGLMSPSSDGLVTMNQGGTIQSSYSTTASQVRRTGVRSLSPDLTVASSASGTVWCVYYLAPTKPQDLIEDPYAGYGVPLSPEEMKQQASFTGFDFYGDAEDGSADHWFMPSDAYPVLAWQTEITGLVGVPDVAGLSPEWATALLEAAGFEPNALQYDYARPLTISSGSVEVQVGAKGQVIATRPGGYLPAGSPVTLVISLGPYDFNDNPGDGSEANPYQIATASQLDSLCGRIISEGQHYILTDDIDMSAYVYNGALSFMPGDFNGNGHTIRGLRINAAYPHIGQSCGLFSIVDSSGCVHDLAVEEASLNIPSVAIAGILVGENRGQVLRCRATGRIIGGQSYIGGLVGSNNISGQLADCRFSGLIQAASSGTRVGGLAGGNMGAILRCCARDVDVSGGTYVGGLAGENGSYAGVIEASYATGTVQGVSYVGGLLGRNGYVPPKVGRSIQAEAGIAAAADASAYTNGVIRDCYAACLVTGQQDMGGCFGSSLAPDAGQESCYGLAPDRGHPSNGLGTFLTAEQMKQQASFADWDFIDTWTICEGKDYPRLRWEDVECEE
jgi:hypothetical protein